MPENPQIAIVTDSACDLPPEFLDERQIHVVPFTLSFGEQQFLDKLTISPDRFYELLRTSRGPAQDGPARVLADRPACPRYLAGALRIAHRRDDLATS